MCLFEKVFKTISIIVYVSVSLTEKIRQSLLLSANCSVKIGIFIAVVLRINIHCISCKSGFSGLYIFIPLLSACHGQTKEKADILFALKPCLSLMKMSSSPSSAERKASVMCNQYRLFPTILAYSHVRPTLNRLTHV